ncbi:MAG: DUF4175 domain-containing protein [Bacteroidetes bacterium]|nr:MAG: DUF4175 domain-containing protein [Bacteroidota bacterium]
MTAKNNYDLLIEELDRFIRKFYVNQLIRGGLYSLALILVLFLGLNFLEHFYYFNSSTRTGLFYTFVGISSVALLVWVVVPLLHYFRLGEVISHEQAAQIIGNHFGNVKDKLLNVLQLKHQADQAGNKELILASIQQKSEEIKLVPFRAAIDLSQNKKYLKYALPPLLLLLFLLLAAPSLIKDSTTRLIHYKEEFEKPAPFHFELNTDQLEVVQYDDFPLTVKVEGEVLPNEVFIDVDNYQYRLTKIDQNTFGYRFSNVQKSTDFKLYSGEVSSPKYTLEVLKKPNILGFEVKLDYPNYTGRKDETLSSIGDLVVPAGTNIDWVFNAENTDQVALYFGGSREMVEAKRFSDDLFTYKKRVLKNEPYKLYVSNEYLPKADSISYSITVIPDMYPVISAEKFQDSLDKKLLFFIGDASDDYGIRNLTFNYRITKENGQQGKLETLPLSFSPGKSTQYTHTWDLHELNLEPGDEVSYYFEVFDNDAVNGSKSSRTNLMLFEMPTVEEYEAMAEQNEDLIKDKLQKSLDESKKIQDDLKKLREKLLQEKEVDWQTKKELEKLLDRQKELQKQIDEAKDAFKENLENQEEYSKQDEEMLQKQEKLQELFDEVMDEEMKKLMEQIQELMDELEKEGALEKMEEMEMNDEEMEMELDRMLEMFKQMELEMEMERFLDKMEELADKQEQLSEETEKLAEEQEQAEQNDDSQKQKELDEKQKELEQKQEELNKEFDELQEKMDEIEQKNEDLENPKDLGDDNQEKMEDIEQDMQDSQQQMQQKQNKKASKKQKSASEKMRGMSMQMQMKMQQQEQEQLEEDMAALRQLLENLVGLSFDQEDLIGQFEEANVNAPRYVDLVQEQFRLKDDFRLIEDSLQALSKRVYQIESFVTEKVAEVKDNMKKSLAELEERRKPQAAEFQQRTMKNVNDLALMLSEVMQQMQQQMAGMMAGDQMCTNPGGNGKPGQVPSDKISQGQQGLNQQMKKMKEALEKGKSQGMSKQFAEMAARQAALRQALQEKQKALQEQGKGSKALQEAIDQMNKVETDLVNKTLTNEMLKRQEEILTRLLEHEKAEREREYDNKRKSETADNYERKLPPSLEEYIKKREAEIEQFKTVSPSLKPYYKFLVEEYFKNIKSN